MKNLFVTLVLMPLFIHCSSSGAEKPVIPIINISDAEIMEGNTGVTTLDYSINLQEAATEDITLNYTTDDGSAFQELDYHKAAGSITIPAGSTSSTLQLQIVTDLIKEGTELFHLVFDAGATQVELSKMSADIKIINDDTQLPYDTDDYTTPASYAGWKQSWADEFDGPAIDQSVWTHEIGNGDNGWGNNELEYYTDAPENSRIENGQLVIEARDDAWNGKKYTSARMITKGAKSFTYSRTDIRAKLPTGQGIWPALWMLGDNIDSKGWPACGEIDIMELIGNQPASSHATVHFGADFSQHKYVGKNYTLSGEIFMDRFHVFSVVREPNHMWFYIDDILFFDFTSKDTQGQPYPFNQPFFFLFNVAIGGDWPGNPDATTVFPQEMLVDYIRVFEKE